MGILGLFQHYWEIIYRETANSRKGIKGVSQYMKRAKKEVEDKYEKYLEKGVHILSDLAKTKIEVEAKKKVFRRITALAIFAILVIGAAIYFGLKQRVI